WYMMSHRRSVLIPSLQEMMPKKEIQQNGCFMDPMMEPLGKPWIHAEQKFSITVQKLNALTLNSLKGTNSSSYILKEQEPVVYSRWRNGEWLEFLNNYNDQNDENNEICILLLDLGFDQQRMYKG